MAINYYSEEIISELKKKDFDLNKIKENVNNIINSNKFLKFLLNDFLDFSQLKNNCFKLSIKEFN
jgi:hypothetical protein